MDKRKVLVSLSVFIVVLAVLLGYLHSIQDRLDIFDSTHPQDRLASRALLVNDHLKNISGQRIPVPVESANATRVVIDFIVDELHRTIARRYLTSSEDWISTMPVAPWERCFSLTHQ